MKIVKSELFFDLSERLLDEGYRVRFRAAGTSMHPAIGDGDALILEPVAPDAVQPGDIVMYRKQQRAVAHRVVHVEETGQAVTGFLLRGDAKPTHDAPVGADEIVGRVVAVEPSRHRFEADGWRDRLPPFVRLTASRFVRRTCAITDRICAIWRIRLICI